MPPWAQWTVNYLRELLRAIHGYESHGFKVYAITASLFAHARIVAFERRYAGDSTTVQEIMYKLGQYRWVVEDKLAPAKFRVQINTPVHIRDKDAKELTTYARRVVGKKDSTLN